jgi:hypothetical protein
VKLDNLKIPRYDLQQADICPLMATLIGTAIPTNNFGKLPYMYPNVSKEYLADAFSNNAYQLHSMYMRLHEQALRKTFHFSFNPREKKIEENVNFLDEQIKLSYTISDYDDIVSLPFFIIFITEINYSLFLPDRQVTRNDKINIRRN